MTQTETEARDLVASVLLEEQRRHDEQANRETDALLLPDDLLPGVGGDEMPLRNVLAIGGRATIGVLFGLALIDAIDNAAFGVLSPNMQKSLGLSDGGIGIVGALAGLTLFVAAIPLGIIGGRARRTAIAGFSTLIWAVAAVLTGASQAIWQLVCVRGLAGIGKANEGPIQASIIVDAYPPEGRGRVFGIHRLASPLGILIGPVLAGGLASLVGGDDGWRWVFIAFAVPAAVLGLAALTLKEPERGRFDRAAVAETGIGADEDEPAISLGAAFARLKKIKTFYFIMAALGAFGFAVTTVPIYLNLIMRDQFNLDAAGRGVVGSITAIGGITGAIVGGRYADRLFRTKPELTMWMSGGALAALGVGFGLQAYAPNVVVFTIIGIVSQALLFAGLVPSSPVVAAVTPYRLRTLSFALVGLYLSLVGGLGGALIVAGLADAHGPQMAVAIVAPISSLVAGALMAYASRYLRGDISAAVADLIEERDERLRVAAGGELPILQVRHLDFSYGQVQVLFDVNVDVRKGEVLALLGTNGAGKSTLLRTISGLAPPDRGTIRLAGKTLTFADANTRVRAGIVQVPGGRAVYPSLTVRENLLAGGYSMLQDRALLSERVESVMELFPILRERLDQRAGSLSGGEQQMLGIATALLLDPEILLIDELSLGLAPVVVQQLLEVVEQLKARGMTIVVVEQSVNVALSIADRAVFMEKGQVRFEGPAADLLERDDLVRAVFLGSEGG